MISQKKDSLAILLTLVCILAVGALAVAQDTASLSRPVLTSLHPSVSVGKAGVGSTLVVASGQHFAHGITTIQIQGTARVTTVINSEALAFELTAADLAQTGVLMITAVNDSGSTSLKSNSLRFVVLP